MSCCIAIGFFELPGLAGGFRYTKIPSDCSEGISFMQMVGISPHPFKHLSATCAL